MDRIGQSARILLILYLLTGTGCYDSADPPPVARAELPEATATIATLHELYPGQTTEVREEIVVRGTVTTSDRAGNFYRSFLVEQDGAAVEVRAGTDETHNRYPPGCRVALRLRGCAIGKSCGVLQIGRLPESYGGPGVEEFGSQVSLDNLIVRGDTDESPTATPIQLVHLRESLCGCLLRVAYMRYAPDEPPTEAIWSGYRRFVDAQGNCLYTYTNPYARFAPRVVPEGIVSLTGILQYGQTPGGNNYILKLRDETDCQR